jgi:hypothetical protein
MTGSRSQNGIIAPLGLRQAFRKDRESAHSHPASLSPESPSSERA